MIILRKCKFRMSNRGALEVTVDARCPPRAPKAERRLTHGSLGRRRGPNSVTFPGGNSRRPFLVELRDRENNNLEFAFMVNHLIRGNARKLPAWCIG